MARPTGDFEQGKRQLLKLIKVVGGFAGCSATTTYYANVLKKSTTQIQKYIKALKTEGLVTVKTTTLLKDHGSGVFYKKRLITPLVKHVRVTPNKLTKEVPAPPTTEEVLTNMYETVQAEEIAREEAWKRALSEEVFDRQAVLLELQQELAAQGIQMEL